MHTNSQQALYRLEEENDALRLLCKIANVPEQYIEDPVEAIKNMPKIDSDVEWAKATWDTQLEE